MKKSRGDSANSLPGHDRAALSIGRRRFEDPSLGRIVPSTAGPFGREP
jgi:hypothetical protein